jgi:hypothetical protein
VHPEQLVPAAVAIVSSRFATPGTPVGPATEHLVGTVVAKLRASRLGSRIVDELAQAPTDPQRRAALDDALVDLVRRDPEFAANMPGLVGSAEAERTASWPPSPGLGQPAGFGQPAAAFPGRPAPPVRKSNTGLVIALVLVAFILIGGCVATIVAVPTLGASIYTSSRDRAKEPIKPVTGTWVSRDRSVQLSISAYGDLSLSLHITGCYGRITQPGDHTFAVTIDTNPCGDPQKPLGKTATLTLNATGDELTLTAGSFSAVLVRKP